MSYTLNENGDLIEEVRVTFEDTGNLKRGYKRTYFVVDEDIEELWSLWNLWQQPKNLNHLNSDLISLVKFGSYRNDTDRVYLKQKHFDHVIQQYEKFGINAFDITFLQGIIETEKHSTQLRIQRCLRKSKVLVAIYDHQANQNKRYYFKGTEPQGFTEKPISL